MGRNASGKRTKLVEAADSLVHLQGFRETTLADVASRARVPLGNVYYYFKSKDELGAAVIARRADVYDSLAVEWGKLADPRARIIAFIEHVEGQRDDLAHSGCPIGSLCQELHKGGGELAEQATTLFTGLLGWLEAQFSALGHEDESADLALHLVAALQGASLLTNTFGDPSVMVREAARVRDWVRTL